MLLLGRRESRNNLLSPRRRLSFPSYAQAHCTQQNAQISGETLQDHCPRQGLEIAFLATPFAVDQKRETETPVGEDGTGRRHGCGASKSEPSFRLREGSGSSTGSRARARSLRLFFAFGLSWSRWSHTIAAQLPTNQAQALGYKGRACSPVSCTMSPQRKSKQAKAMRATSRAQCKQKRNSLSMNWWVMPHIQAGQVDLAASFRVAYWLWCAEISFPSGTMD